MLGLNQVWNKLPTPARQAIKDRLYPDLLAEGETSPEFHLQNWDDVWFRLRDRWCLLVFYPADDTPGCTLQLQDFQKHYAQLQALGCDVMAINPAEAKSHKAFADKCGLQFPLLTDRGGSVSRQFKAVLPVPGARRIIRTVYLVNPERKIRLANRGAPSVAAIVRSIQALQQATKAGM